ncbi:MAG: hypothetical protein M3O06_00855 [Pseudomonadota bacterium]|nr:hypothetical protein [Pseudomonadota bacterium]
MNHSDEATGIAAVRPPEPSGRLLHLGVMRFSGTDAAGFLQGQLSNDTRRLTAGPLLAAYSSPQGRVLAVMHLLAHTDGILAVLPREVIAATLEQMRRYVLRAKVQIEDISHRCVLLGVHGASALSGAALSVPDERSPQGAEIAVYPVGPSSGRSPTGRFWVIDERLAPTSLDGLDGDPLGVENAWRLADIRAGLPQIYTATRDLFVAQMLNLDLVDGISFSKGCFTGQEIIARTQHLGRVKRRLFRLGLPAGDWQIGQMLHLTDGRSGRLVEFARTASGFEALAVLGDASPADAPAAIDARDLPLPYSLPPSRA